MIKYSTHFLRSILALLCLSACLLVASSTALYAQCSDSTPVYEVDLTGKPNGSWTSPSVNRSGQCCTAATNTSCVQFSVTLDPLSGGLQFDITSGPVPAGAMYYQVGCGANVSVGDSLCVTGPGPHLLTLCMPGNAKNTFTIRSIAAYEPVADASVTIGCSQTLTAPIAFDPATVSWKDITGGGIYNKYLSCTTGCSSTTVTPDANAPAFVDYEVCGTSQSAVCTSIPYCDVIRVYFYAPIQVAINPDPAVICPGTTGVDLSSTVSGGSGTYTYRWTDANGNLVASTATYRATSIGKYTLEVRNENYPNCSTRFFDEVTVVDDLTANAGPDQRVCAQFAVQLNGAVTGASGGIWSGGSGSFSPANTDLAALYTPTAGEIAAGSLTLTLSTTGNGSCSAVSDKMVIIFYGFTVAVEGTKTICNGSTASLSAVAKDGIEPYTYKWSTGESTQSISNKAAGTYSITVTDAKGCTSKASATVIEVTGPSDFTTTTKPSTCGSANGEIIVSSVDGGTSPYSYSLNGGTYQTSATFGGILAGEHQITVKDANGCLFSKKTVLANIPGPTDLTATTKPSTCSDNNGELTVSSVLGGTSPYSYSINGTTYQNTATFSKLLAGTYTLSIKDANGCAYTEAVEVIDLAGPSDIQATTTPSSCTTNDGTITISSVSGGTSPYTYSLDGTNYQSSTTFSGLAPITHKIWVKDANGCTASFPIEVGTDGPTAAETSITNASCGVNDGAITVNAVTAGSSPYLYSLDANNYQESATFSGLAASSYTLTIKDAKGCTLSLPQNISNAGGPESYTVTAVDENCDLGNGSIRISSVIGGTSPYTFSIDGGKSYSTESLFTGLSEGTYQLAVKDANGCITLTSQLLLNSPAPTAINYTTLQETCGEQNGSLTISEVRGGISPFTYSLDGTSFQESATFNGLTAGTHQLTVQDSKGCTYSETIVVDEITGPSFVSASSKDASCSYNDGEITVTEVTGGTSPYFYSLNGTNYQTYTTFSGLDAGAYTLQVRDVNGCSISKEVFVARPGAILEPVQQVSCFGAADGRINITPVGGSDYTEYSLDGGASFQKEPVFSNLGPGTYTVIVKLNPECTIAFNDILIKEPTQITAIVVQTAISTSIEGNGTAEITEFKGGTGHYFFTVDGVAYGGFTSITALAAGEHSLMIMDANGCEEIIPFIIEGLSELEIPNGFTPNRDGINDSWAIKNLSHLYPGCMVAVYNRWGSPVFQSTGYSKEWDGTNSGKILPDGAYYYIIQLDDQQKPLKGTITIMR